MKRLWTKMAASLLVAALGYLAWIPAVADNSHPLLATIAGLVSLLGCLASVCFAAVGAARAVRGGSSGRRATGESTEST